MAWYSNLVLTTMELTSLLLLWGGLNKKVRQGFKKKIFVFILILITTEILEYLGLSSFGFIASLTILLICMIKFYKIPLKEAVFEFILVLVAAMAIQLLFMVLLFFQREVIEYTFVNGFKVNLLMLLVVYFIAKQELLTTVKQVYLAHSKLISIIILNIMLGIILILGIWRVDQHIVYNYFALIVIGVLIWAIMNIYFLYQSIKINQQNKVILTHEKYIPYLKGLVDEVRQRQHDFKNHFNVLYGLTEIEDSDTSRNELKNYLETIVERIRPVDQLLNIHDTILTAIVYSKKNLAEEKNILFNAMIKNCVPEYPLKKYELVEVVGNLLDNAIEAVENNDGIKKEVNLILGAENGVPIIQVENTKDISCVIEPDKIFEKGFSTKEGKNRGYGLYNIKQLIHYYNGTIELSFSDQLTIFKILF